MAAEKIQFQNEQLIVPDNPVIPFIEGDGIGPDIWRAASRVIEQAVRLCWQGKRRIQWKEVLAGEKAHRKTGKWLPEETLQAFRTFRVGIKGPLTTPVGGGIRSLNVALRQQLDLYACVRPVRYFPGVPSPVREPQKVNMVVFRENTEDVYAGFEFESAGEDTRALIKYLAESKGWQIRPDSGVGIKPISKFASLRLLQSAVEYALAHGRKSITMVHKGNIQKFTEGAFRSWGYEFAGDKYADSVVSWEECHGNPPDGKILIKDAIADIFFQQALTRPEEFDVIATTNLNGDYISDALAAQVGGVGMAPGANINYQEGYAIFEATHGTAPKYADMDKVNPTSLILSGAMMLEHMGWTEASRKIESGLEKALASGQVTYDLARLMPGAEEVSCSGFADLICELMA
ncbi:MAG: NADP-dependent isocitrate dehydrogenase [Desulfobacteraceae bacterium 4484_190.3]|nr:MAG: NADP-dependent isocitrate dehydrogenase [Desulfobacteraceae bacterium 4484_190.3]